MVAGVLRSHIRCSINNRLYLAGLFSCKLAALSGDCREYKVRMTTEGIFSQTKIEFRVEAGWEIGSEYKMMPICLI